MAEFDFNKFAEDIGFIKGTLEEGFKAVTDRLDKINGCVEKHEDRISKTEKDITKVKTVGSVIVVIFGMIGGFLKELLWSK